MAISLVHAADKLWSSKDVTVSGGPEGGSKAWGSEPASLDLDRCGAAGLPDRDVHPLPLLPSPWDRAPQMLAALASRSDLPYGLEFSPEGYCLTYTCRATENERTNRRMFFVSFHCFDSRAQPSSDTLCGCNLPRLVLCLISPRYGTSVHQDTLCRPRQIDQAKLECAQVG